MKTWAKLAKIDKVSKKLDFVVTFATKSFLMSENLCDLVGNKACLVPPVIDFPREATLCDVSVESNRAKLSITESFDLDDISVLKDHWFMVEENVLKSVFSDVSELELNAGTVIGKSVIDGKAGEIGICSDIQGTSTQKMLVVSDNNGCQILIPYVNEIVKEVKDFIIVECPNGLLELNN